MNEPAGRALQSIRSSTASLALALLVGAADVARAAESGAGVIELDETVISGNQELPKVLYIVPWQQPNGLPEIELSTGAAQSGVFRRLYPPAYRRELAFHETARNKDADEAIPEE